MGISPSSGCSDMAFAIAKWPWSGQDSEGEVDILAMGIVVALTLDILRRAHALKSGDLYWVASDVCGTGLGMGTARHAPRWKDHVILSRSGRE